MKVPTVRVEWVQDPLVRIVMRVDDDVRNNRVGFGATLAEAFEGVARDIRRHAEHTDEKRMRGILGDPG